MLNLARPAALLACLAFFPLSATADEVTIRTARGDVTVVAAPDRIAVLDIAALDTLTALGVAAQGVPDRLYVDYLDAVAARAQPVGTLFEPDLEALAALDPELVIAGGRSSTRIEMLAELAPTIDMTIWEDVIGEGRDRIAAYGLLFNRQDRAAEMIAELDAKLAETTAAAQGKGRGLILSINGPKISAYGKGSRFGWIHDALGLPEARENLDAAVHGDAVSFEFIAETNPDWIFVIDRSAAIGEDSMASDVLDNPLVARTVAAQRGQILYLSSTPAYIAGGGFTSMMTTLGELLTAFSR